MYTYMYIYVYILYCIHICTYILFICIIFSPPLFHPRAFVPRTIVHRKSGKPLVPYFPRELTSLLVIYKEQQHIYIIILWYTCANECASTTDHSRRNGGARILTRLLTPCAVINLLLHFLYVVNSFIFFITDTNKCIHLQNNVQCSIPPSTLPTTTRAHFLSDPSYPHSLLGLSSTPKYKIIVDFLASRVTCFFLFFSLFLQNVAWLWIVSDLQADASRRTPRVLHQVTHPARRRRRNNIHM